MPGGMGLRCGLEAEAESGSVPEKPFFPKKKFSLSNMPGMDGV